MSRLSNGGAWSAVPSMGSWNRGNSPNTALRRMWAALWGDMGPRGANVLAFHADQPNDFYRLWLDEAMVYSCAYFETEEMSLNQAQISKLDHICCKLQLQPGEQFLDIGCGWGALALHAAQYFGVQAHGITVNARQLEWAQERIRVAGLHGRVKIDLVDYRNLPGQSCYDKIACVGIFESMGLQTTSLNFQAVQGLLKPNGQFLSHCVTHQTQAYGNGERASLGHIQRSMERARFEVMGVEYMRPHLAKTLRHWVQRLQDQHARALEHVSEATYRAWLLGISTTAIELESGDLRIYQILAGRTGAQIAKLPSARHTMDPCSAPQVAPSRETLQSLCALEVLL
jgi:cyclopropane-fatty-acyl-phospholipid synthase